MFYKISVPCFWLPESDQHISKSKIKKLIELSNSCYFATEAIQSMYFLWDIYCNRGIIWDSLCACVCDLELPLIQQVMPLLHNTWGHAEEDTHCVAWWKECRANCSYSGGTACGWRQVCQGLDVSVCGSKKTDRLRSYFRRCTIMFVCFVRSP